MSEIKCKKCGSDTSKNGFSINKKRQKYICKSCGYNFELPINEQPAHNVKDIGMDISTFREKHDIDFIVEKTLKLLDPEKVYEKQDIVKMTGLRPAYPGLSAALENASEYKGRAGGNSYWGHPNTIRQLKAESIMT